MPRPSFVIASLVFPCLTVSFRYISAGKLFHHPSNPHQRRLICFLASSTSAEASSLDPMWNPSSRIGVEKGASQLEGQPGLRMMARLDPSGEKNRGSFPPKTSGWTGEVGLQARKLCPMRSAIYHFFDLVGWTPRHHARMNWCHWSLY